MLLCTRLVVWKTVEDPSISNISLLLPDGITRHATRKYLLSKQTTHSSQHTVLLWVVWMIFAWNFEDRRKGSGVGIDSVSYSVGNLYLWSSVWTHRRAVPEETDMLVDQDDPNIFAVCEALKRRFDGCSFRLVIDDEKVLLRFGAGSDMLCTPVRYVSKLNIYFGGDSFVLISRERKSRSLPFARSYLHRCLRARGPLQSPIRIYANVRTNAISSHFGASVRSFVLGGRLASSPITARNCRSLKSACDDIVTAVNGRFWGLMQMERLVDDAKLPV